MIPLQFVKFGRIIPSQDTSVVSPAEEPTVLQVKLPILMKVWNLVEDYTGFLWKATSFIRSQNAPSHNGNALDIAPDITKADQSKYSLSAGSDPVLYKREPLMRALQAIAAEVHPDYSYDVGIFVESDHIHIGLFIPEDRSNPEIRIYKWGALKESYGDTRARASLPLLYSEAT